jgi:hypothetical protein
MPMVPTLQMRKIACLEINLHILQAKKTSTDL